MKLIVVASLFVFAACLARLLFGLLRPGLPRKGGGAARSLSSGTSAKLPQIVPSPSLVVDVLPPLDAREVLASQRVAPPPAVDFGVIGVDEGRQAADEAIWRVVKRSLAARGKDARVSGGS